MEKIGLGGGCHWCTEAVFQSLIGVEKVEQGWIASDQENDSLSEAVIVYYDPVIIDLKILVSIHLYTHSCTSLHSMRSKYRSAVYYFSTNQKDAARYHIKTLQEEFEDVIITKVLPFVSFKENDESFQDYYFKDPSKQFCETYINPKFQLLMRQFSKYVNTDKLKHLSGK